MPQRRGCGSPLTLGFRASDDKEFVVRGPGLREGLFLMRSWGGNASLGRGGNLGQLPEQDQEAGQTEKRILPEDYCL